MSVALGPSILLAVQPQGNVAIYQNFGAACQLSTGLVGFAAGSLRT